MWMVDPPIAKSANATETHKQTDEKTISLEEVIRCPFNSPNFNSPNSISPNSNSRVRVRVRGRVRVSVRVRVKVRVIVRVWRFGIRRKIILCGV